MMKPFTKSILSVGAGVLLFSSASLAHAQCKRIYNASAVYDTMILELGTSAGGGGDNAGQRYGNFGILLNCQAGSQITVDMNTVAGANRSFSNFLNRYRAQSDFITPPYFAPLSISISRAVRTGPSTAYMGGWVPTGGYNTLGADINIYTTSGGYSASGFPATIPVTGDYYIRFSPAMYNLHNSRIFTGTLVYTIFSATNIINIGGQPRSLVVFYDNSGDTGVTDPPPPDPMSCGIGLKLTPDDGRINFGQMSTSDLNNGRSVTRELTLSVGRREACNRNQNITMTFNPDTKGLISGASASFSQGVMRLENNTRIEIRDKSNNAAVNLTPGTKFNFGSLPQQTSGVNTNPARLDKIFSFTWKRDGTSPVKVGTWNAQILLEIEGD